MPSGKIGKSAIGAIRRVFRITVIVCSVTAAFAHADPSTQLPAGVTVELIAPERVAAGESFTVYALITNHGEALLRFPLVQRAAPGLDGIQARYRYLHCGIQCVQSGSLEPGQSAYLGAGMYYYADPLLAGGELVIDDYQLGFLDTEPLEVKWADLGQSLTVPITLPDDAGTYPPLTDLSREALQTRDLLAPGDAMRVVDANTGNEWVRLEATMGMSLGETVAALNPGGQFEDYSLARISQVEELVLNHVLASGLTVQLADMYRNPAPALEAALIRFIELMRPSMVMTEGEAVSMQGAVGDGIVHSFRGHDGEVVGVLSVVANRGGTGSCTCPPPPALSRFALSIPFRDAPGNAAGLWLVKPPEPEPARPAGEASFHDDELVIPAMRIDGSDYRVTLRMIDRRLEVLRIASLRPIPATAASIPFDSRSGRITLPEVVVIDENGATSTLRVTLALVDHDGMPLIQVVQRTVVTEMN